MGTGDGRVRLVDASTGVARWDVLCYPRSVQKDGHSVAMSPDGRFVASVGGSEEGWKLLDAESGVVCMTGARHDGTGVCSCKVRKHGVEKGIRTALDAGCPVQAHTAGLRAVALSPCGLRLATGGDDFTVILWDAQDGKAEQVMHGHTRRITSVSFSVDGALLASGSLDGCIRVWDAATGALLRAIDDDFDMELDGVHFSPASRNVAGVGHVGSLVQWDVDSGAEICDFHGCSCAVFSPHGRTIATQDPSGADVLVLDATTGAEQCRMVGHLHRIFALSWSVDGSELASGSYGTCKVWDSSTGALLRTMELGGGIYSLCWGRDWVQDTERAVAFAMGHHPRLGAGSEVLGLDEELLRMVLDRG